MIIKKTAETESIKKEIGISTDAPLTFNDESRSVTICMTTDKGSWVRDPSTWRKVFDIQDVEGVTTYEPDGKLPFIDSHDTESITKILGTCSDIKAKNGELLCLVTFANTDEGNRAYQLVKEGHLRKFSVSYIPIEIIEVTEKAETTYKGKKITGPCRIIAKSVITELSAVIVPADRFTCAKSSIIDNDKNTPITKGGTMTEEERLAAEAAANKAAELKAEAARKAAEAEAIKKAGEEAVKQYQGYVETVKKKASLVGITDVAWIDTLIAKNLPIEQAKDAIIDKIAESKSYVPSTTIKKDIVDNIKEIAELGLKASCGFKLSDDEKSKISKSGVGALSLQGVARKLLDAHGIVHGFDNYSVAEAVISKATSADFVEILANVANKQGILESVSAQTTFQKIVYEIPITNFLEVNLNGLTPFGYSTIVAEDHGPNVLTLGEHGERIQLGKLHDTYTLSVEAIANDALFQFSSIPKKFYAGQLGTLNRDVYKKLMANGAMLDTKAFFHADHGNLKVNSGIISLPAISEAVASMISQKVNGANVNYIPRILIVAPKYAALARQICQSVVDITKNNAAINPFYGDWSIEVVCDGVLADTTLAGQADNAFYLLSSKDDAGIVVGYLNNMRTPNVTSRISMAGEKAGVIFDSKFFYGIALANARAMYMGDGVVV